MIKFSIKIVLHHNLCTPNHFCSWSLRVGEADFDAINEDRRGFDIPIEDVFIHPEFKKGKAYFDVAVLQTEVVKISSETDTFLQPVCLPGESSANRDEYARDSVQLVGL